MSPNVPDLQWIPADQNPWHVPVLDVGPVTQTIQRGSAVDVRSAEGATPLMNAVQGGDMAKAALLLDCGASVNAADQRGFTSLHRAAEFGHLDLVRLLLDRGARADLEAQGYTAQALAELGHHREIVKLLQQS